jgi:hypothetical protein
MNLLTMDNESIAGISLICGLSVSDCLSASYRKYWPRVEADMALVRKRLDRYRKEQ